MKYVKVDIEKIDDFELALSKLMEIGIAMW